MPVYIFPRQKSISSKMYIIYVYKNCNCRTNNTCRSDGKCLSSNCVYSAEVLLRNNELGHKYFGICETEFKTRLGKHKNLFKNRQKEKDTELSK